MAKELSHEVDNSVDGGLMRFYFHFMMRESILTNKEINMEQLVVANHGFHTVKVPLCYHSRHFLIGFMGDPRGQLKVSENSFMLLMLPITLNEPGACTSVVI